MSASPALDDTDTPCSMSAPVIQGVLRGQLGYQGLVISDGLQMHAILDQYGAPQGCVQAALAGCDLLIIGNGGDNADPTGKDVQTPCIRALCDAVADGTLPMRRWMNRYGGSWHASWRWAGLCPPAMPPARIGAIMLPLRMRWPKPA